MTELEDRLQEFLKQVWNEGTVEAVPGFLANAYTIHCDPGDPWEGQTLDRAGFVKRFTLSRAPFPDQSFTVRRMLTRDGLINVFWDWQGTHLADLPGLKATGLSVRMSGFTDYAFQDGALTGHWQVCDRLSIYRQLTAPQT